MCLYRRRQRARPFRRGNQSALTTVRAAGGTPIGSLIAGVGDASAMAGPHVIAVARTSQPHACEWWQVAEPGSLSPAGDLLAEPVAIGYPSAA